MEERDERGESDESQDVKSCRLLLAMETEMKGRNADKQQSDEEDAEFISPQRTERR